MTTQFEAVLNNINDLDQKIFDLKRSVHKRINEITVRYLIARKKEHPADVGTYGSFTIDADDWSVDTIGGNIDVQIYPMHGEADEYNIPIKYFTDEETLVAYEEHCQQVKEERDEREQKRTEEKERMEFERLKAKLGE